MFAELIPAGDANPARIHTRAGEAAELAARAGIESARSR
jgi:hypothetical protein